MKWVRTRFTGVAVVCILIGGLYIESDFIFERTFSDLYSMANDFSWEIVGILMLNAKYIKNYQVFSCCLHICFCNVKVRDISIITLYFYEAHCLPNSWQLDRLFNSFRITTKETQIFALHNNVPNLWRIRPLVRQLVQHNNKVNTKWPALLILWEGTVPITGSTHKGKIMQRTFACHNLRIHNPTICKWWKQWNIANIYLR